METNNKIPPTNGEHEHKGAPCSECPEQEKEGQTIDLKLDLNNEFNEIKEDFKKHIKEQMEELRGSFKEIVKEALKTRVTIGNLKPPKQEARKEEPNPFLDLMKSTI